MAPIIRVKRARYDHSILFCDEDDGDCTWIEPESCMGAMDVVVTSPSPSRVDPDYLAGFNTIRPDMRSIVLDWMQQVCQEYALCRETFHLATTYLDRYLSVRLKTTPSSLQLVGITALFLAGKLEEVKLPCVEAFAMTCAGTYDIAEILSTEHDMVAALEWTLKFTSPSSWATFYLQRGIDHCFSLELEQRCRQHRYLLQSDRFVRVMEIIDYSRLFVESLQHGASILAATVLFYVFDEIPELIQSATELTRFEIAPCLKWVVAIADRLPFLGLKAISARGSSFEVYAKQTYHPLALQLCLSSA